MSVQWGYYSAWASLRKLVNHALIVSVVLFLSDNFSKPFTNESSIIKFFTSNGLCLSHLSINESISSPLLTFTEDAESACLGIMILVTNFGFLFAEAQLKY